MTDVLRSRYSAFSWRDVGYIMKTTHPVCRDYREDQVAWAKDLNKSGMFDSYEFVNLQPGPEETGATENEGFIEFKVTLESKDDLAGPKGQQTVITEKSKFLRDDKGVWTYATGEVRSDTVGLDTVINN